MTMPEAVVNKYSQAIACKNPVRAPRQIVTVQTKPKAGGIDSFSNNQLRLSILYFDCCHYARPNREVDCIDHPNGSNRVTSHYVV